MQDEHHPSWDWPVNPKYEFSSIALSSRLLLCPQVNRHPSSDRYSFAAPASSCESLHHLMRHHLIQDYRACAFLAWRSLSCVASLLLS